MIIFKLHLKGRIEDEQNDLFWICSLHLRESENPNLIPNPIVLQRNKQRKSQIQNELSLHIHGQWYWDTAHCVPGADTTLASAGEQERQCQIWRRQAKKKTFGGEGKGGVLTVEKKALKRCLEFECLGLGFGVLFLTPSGSRGIVYSGYFQNLTCLMQTWRFYEQTELHIVQPCISKPTPCV